MVAECTTVNSLFAADIEATALLQGEKIYKNNMTYVHVNDLFIDFAIGNASVHLSNLFDGDRQLGNYNIC